MLEGQKNKHLTPAQALQKVKQFCAYQERCHREVKEKLYSYGLNLAEVEQNISTLIEENYLNEERFAIQFAGGRFRMKNWGKIKIRYELNKKQVSDFCIKKALAAIDYDEYENTLNKEAHQKWSTLKSEKNIFTKRRKVLNYLLQKGFESELCREVIKHLETLNK